MKKYITLFFIICIIQIAESQNDALNAIADRYIKEFKLPGIAISVIKADTVYYGVAGVKKCGNPEKVSLDSKFHIGSNAKAITATIAAILVEENKIKWNSKIIEVISELEGNIREEYREVTLESLLSNRGLIQPFEEDDSKEWKGIPSSISKSSNSKLEFAKYALNLEPKISTQDNHAYSNGGFIIAALMLEEATGLTWKELVAKFNQEYGVDTFLGFPNQEISNGTHGHKKRLGKYKAVLPKDEYKFGFDFSAAGNLSINVFDFSKVIKQHLYGLLGENNVLKSTTYSKLHFGLEKYSLGWYNGTIGNTDQKFSYHGGSLGTFSSAVMLSADREVAIIILVNSDSKKANELKNSLRVELWEKYGSL